MFLHKSFHKGVVFCLTLVLLVVFSGGALAQSGVEGNYCVRDFQPGAVCTANDVRIEELTPVNIIETCSEGTPGEAEVVFEALVSADGSPDRYDIGLFVALDGGSARDGDSCLHDYLDPPLTANPTYGDYNVDGVDDILDGPWLENDGDMCGDIGTNTQVIKTLQQIRFACEDQDQDGFADISVCASWDNNAGTECSELSGAFPGTNSKCGCDLLNLPFSPTSVTMTGIGAGDSAWLAGVATVVMVMFLALMTGVVLRRRRAGLEG